MASTGGVMYLRPYGAAASPTSTGGVMFVSIRALSGIYQEGVSTTQTRPNDVAWLPSAQTPIGRAKPDGTIVMEPAWYRFFQHVADVRLGGRAAASLPDVITTVEATQTAAVQSGQQVSALTQQSQANAESLNVVRQVVQNNALVGAGQIPPVVLSPYENIP